MNSKFYKCCAVPQCESNTKRTPGKLFIYVPHSVNGRKKWLQLARRDLKDPTLVQTQSKMYFCEDHFDLPNDMENYTQYRLMGSVPVVRMKAGCLPSKFACQPDRKKRTAIETTRPLAIKRQRLETIAEFEREMKEVRSISMAEAEKPGPSSDDMVTDHPSNDDDTEIKLNCQYICIGSYTFKPHHKVRISSDGVTILAPISPLGVTSPQHVPLNIPLKSVVHVLANSDARPTILLYTEAKTGECVRGALRMRRGDGGYFDPTSSIDQEKRITLVPLQLSRRSVAALRSLFGMVLDELDALDARRALGALAGSASDHSAHSDAEHPPSPGHVSDPANGAPLPPGSPVDMKDNASTTSSIIFPPTPTPISLSSHSSSLHSPKSSQSSKKRKNRHKKNKSNKKMKYVLVKNPEPHPVDAFLAGVAPILKSLSPVFLNLAKSEIISAALKYERNMLTENCNGTDDK